MTRGAPSDPPPAGQSGEDLRDLARDWITLWQSELAALAVDREAQEAVHVLLSLWAGAAGGLISFLPRGMPGESARQRRRAARNGAAGTDAAPRSPPAAAAPDPRDAEVERLRARVAELERRLAGLERKRG
jgi:ubiquinone biosynthesis protein UbiJ